MQNSAVYTFVENLFSKLHISTHLIDYAKRKIPSQIDLGLRALLYGIDDYENILRNSLCEAKDNVIYRFVDEYRCNYVFLKFPRSQRYFFVGPYLTDSLSEKQITAIFENKTESLSLTKQLVVFYNNLPVMKDENILLTIVHTFGEALWGDSENFYMEYVKHPIPDATPPVAFWSHQRGENADALSFATIEENYKNEETLMRAVAKGELHKITAIASAVFNNGTEERISDSIRNRKNYLIILNTLLRKAAENGGVHPVHIHSFSSSYAMRIEEVKTIPESIRLQGEMIREYCLFVRQKSIKKYSFYVGKAMLLISCDLTANLSLKNIAEKLNVNPCYLSALFSKECGCSLTDYVHEQRLEEAMRLLLQTDKTILRIATDCGFNDVRYFNRCFKKKTNLTPSEYRKNGRT